MHEHALTPGETYVQICEQPPLPMAQLFGLVDVVDVVVVTIAQFAPLLVKDV